MDPALTGQTIGELLDSWTAQVSDSMEHIKQCKTSGIVSVNLCSRVIMTAEAMRQQGTKVRQHMDCELERAAAGRAAAAAAELRAEKAAAGRRQQQQQQIVAESAGLPISHHGQLILTSDG